MDAISHNNNMLLKIIVLSNKIICIKYVPNTLSVLHLPAFIGLRFEASLGTLLSSVLPRRFPTGGSTLSSDTEMKTQLLIKA